MKKKLKTVERRIVLKLREISRSFPGKAECLKLAKVKPVGSKTRYTCSHCKEYFRKEYIRVDHIKPLGSEPTKENGLSWDTYIKSLFCESDNLAVLCIDCHEVKTNSERKERVDLSKTRDGHEG